MARSHAKSKSARTAADQATLARPLAPEDVRRGDYVVLLYEIIEYPSWYWCDDATFAAREEVVRICHTPRDEPTPLKVRSACLPFVLVAQPCGRQRSLDLRRCRVARLDKRFARTAWKGCRRALKKSKKAIAQSV